LRSALSAILIVASWTWVARAQSENASLTVSVTDSSGATVPGATITVRHTSTTSKRESISGGDGRAMFGALAPGLYDVTVKLDGFKQFRDPQVRLQVAQAGTLPVRLEVGAVNETVEVPAAIPLLNITSAAQGTVITEEKVHALPLNGRQFIQLALLVPGANGGGRAVQQNATGRLNQTGGLSIGGGRTNNTLFLVDGAIDTDPDYNSLNYSPSVDGISEFQVQTSQFAAEYGRAGAQVNVVTKSGAAQVHGSAFEFARSKRFDAKPFNLVGDLPKFRRDNFGGTLGGPLVKGRLFFFGAYEQLRRREAASGLTTVTVPTDLERQGDFSRSPGGGIFDPATSSTARDQFPNNRIPLARIDPLALAAVQALPLPNVGAREYVNTSELTNQNIYNYSLRLDLNAGPGNAMFSRLSLADESAVIPDSVPGRLSVSNGRPVNAAAGWTKVLGSTMVNEMRLGFSQLSLTSGLPELSFNVNGTQMAIPRFVVGGYPAMGGAGAFTGTNGGGIVNVRNRTFQLYDNVSWQQGRHAFKAGAEFLWVEYNRTEVPSTLGTFTFVSGYTSRSAGNDGTGNALASLLLGLPQIANRAVGPSTIHGRQPSFSAYAQDDWRLSDRLTLNLGLRYEVAPPMYDANGMMASVDYRNTPTPQQIFAEGRLAFYTPTVFVCGQNGYPKGCAYTDKKNVAPRLGVSWHAADHTVVRGGAGIYFAPQDGNPLFRLAAGIPGNIAQALTFNPFVPGGGPGYNVFGPAILGPVQIQQAGIDLFQKTSRSTQWTLGVQRELGEDWVIDLSYVGTRAKYLEQNVQPNNAQPGLGAVDPRRPFAALKFAANTAFPPYVTVQGDRVPVGQINFFPHSARSDYNALELRVERRFNNGFSLLSAYTLSKARSNAPQYRNAGGVNGAENSPPQNSFDLNAEWGPAYYDARHRWVTSLTYALPYSLQVAGIWAMQSGFPFTVNLQGDTAGVGGGTGGIFIRPNAVPGISPYLPSSQWKNGSYLDPAAFAPPPAGTFGNVGRNGLVGPGYADLDLALSRGFPLGATHLELRAEVFNLLNRRNYTLVGRILNVTNFGRLISQADPRQMQFSARVTF
jgi:outer membrane receptor protein involved in Fe transport